jgi:hypothetical protein
MTGVAGIDLADVLADAMTQHGNRKCKFKEGALERLVNSPEFAALAAKLESEEAECSLKSAA